MSQRSQALLALLVGNVLLALGPWLVRLADVGPIATGFWRLAIAAPALVAAGLAGGGARQLRSQPRLVAGLVLGGLFFGVDLAAWHLGILRTRLANAALLANMASFLFPLYGFAVARRLPSRAQATALALAVAGTGLLLGRSLQLSPRNLAGDLLCLLAGAFYTLYLIAVDRARTVLPPFASLGTVTVAGILPLLAMALWSGETIMPTHWTPVVLLAFGSQVLGQGMLVFAIGAADPLAVGLALLIQPVVSAMIGGRLYGERLTGWDLLGTVAIGAALVLVRRRPVERATG